jgi:hypothetical protein
LEFELPISSRLQFAQDTFYPVRINEDRLITRAEALAFPADIITTTTQRFKYSFAYPVKALERIFPK